MKLVSELNRRNVTRVALLYLLVAWLLIQVAETVLPLFQVPDGVLRGLIVVLMLGFVPALVFAWAFELTPDGLKREREVEVSSETRRRTSNKLNAATLIVAALGIGLMTVDRLVPARSTAPPPSVDSTATPQPTPVSEDVSIAVLPFLNMSPDPDNAFFAEGISEEILNLLSRVPQLEVVGRTSSFRFKGSNEDLPTIGRQLGVSHLLEGSVRKADDRVRITAQLVETSGGVRLWGDSWDRELDNVFQVQDEIGRAVTAALRRELAGDVASPAPLPTTAPEPYALYLRGRALLAQRGAENMHQAIDFLQQGIALDPEYAPAHAVLGQALALLPLYDFADPGARSEWARKAIESAERALSLDPDQATAWAALGIAQAFHRWDWGAARIAFNQALRLAPTNAEIANLAGDYYRIIRDVDRALELESDAVRLDPLRAFNHSDLAHAYHIAGDCEAALESARSAYALDPAMAYAHLELVLCNRTLGRIDAMREAVEQARRDVDPRLLRSLGLEFWLALSEGRREHALELLSEASEGPADQGQSPGRIGFGWLLLGESERALRWFEIAYETRDWAMVISEPIDFDVIANDPVASAILDRPELATLFQLRKSNNRSSSH